jgi:hypothetical protein
VIYATPQLGSFGPRNVGGVVRDSVFSENAGLAIWDVDPASGPSNEMRYDNNQFYAFTFGNLVYVNSRLTPGGSGVDQLNGMVSYHPDGPPTAKSAVPNERVFVEPKVGALLGAPPLLGVGAPAVTQTFLGYAWSGGRTATLAGQTLTADQGLLLISTPGPHTLAVDGAALATVQLPVP